ncbi:hypothetical protein SH580_21845 [Coraliomargarita algicola]|uniref:TonB C-terminal domain-containing protein n=1 Tax=Coraliomargarita algicola TaxID=3092156 RepID=A0ABZ0RJ13_9BACT|nr:hypothetical protein [Coraliomargarita sp. J2-16]WPJ96062.1 hypothetical protein SH580_21845 [Coraliomargarita sp. J2-16]
MPDPAIEPSSANPFSLDVREPRWVTWVAVLATLLVHLGVVLIVPEELMPLQSDSGEEAAADEVYDISLVEPVEPHYVEANPEAPENEPDRTDQYSYRSQQAADDSPLSDALNKPHVEGEEDSQKIVQGTLEPSPPIEPGVYAPNARAGEGEGDQGGKLGQPQELAPPKPTQPLPAPAFIQQDPVTEEGPGSRSDFAGEAQEVFENPDPEAPIDVYRPQPSLEQSQQTPGDGAGGAVEAQPKPRARPRLAPELITGPLMRSQGSARRRGVIAQDATFSEFGEYEQQFYAAIQTGWYQEIEFFQPIDTATSVQVRFTLHADGRVTDVKAVRTTASEIATFICETAITKRSPFRPWTQEMVKVFGQQRTLNVSFHYR